MFYRGAFRFEMGFFDASRFHCSKFRKEGTIVKIVKTVAAIREFVRTCQKEGKTIGLVPTMGALHEGHASLIEAAHKENDITIVSVFVNPTQFGEGEDFEAYPRTLDADAKRAEAAGADVIFAPSAKEMYPSKDMTWVEVTGNITQVLCGRSRPIHFRGVTTVVSKLFHLTVPQRAYFGLKDAQQTEVLRRMVTDLFFDVELRIMPIVREKDGLAKSSRNIYLSEKERTAALVLSRSLAHTKEEFAKGERKSHTLVEQVKEEISQEPLAQIEYVEIYKLPGLLPAEETLSGRHLLAVAVRFGTTRLIDNVVLED